MATVVSSILRAAVLRDDEPLSILTFPTHEAYEWGLAATGHRFFLWNAPGMKQWDTRYRPLPPNHTLLDAARGASQLPHDVVLDVILSQTRLGNPSQFTIGQSLARSFHVPHVAIEHILPQPGWGRGVMSQLHQMSADIDVFISEYNRDQWGWGEGEGEAEATVVHHGMDTETFRPAPPEEERQAVILSVVNDWINRDWCCGFRIWERVTKDLPVRVRGNTPGLSTAASSVEELVSEYQHARIFLNTSTHSPVPMALLEAMSCGCAVVSTATCMMPEIIRNGSNGFITNNEQQLREYLEKLLADADLAARLGDAARQTVLNRFSMERHVEGWNRVFRRAVAITQRGRK